jgi:inorganic pyrophosphatase
MVHGLPLMNLFAYLSHETVRVVIECVAGASWKSDYDPEAGGFIAKRALPLGVTFPFDFGFVPGTRAEDGDPVDALVLSRGGGFPGLIVPCHVIGMVVFRQREEGVQSPITNNRLIVVPAFSDAVGLAFSEGAVPHRVQVELERFFRATVAFTGEEPVVSRWTEAGPAHAYLERALTNGTRPPRASSP